MIIITHLQAILIASGAAVAAAIIVAVGRRMHSQTMSALDGLLSVAIVSDHDAAASDTTVMMIRHRADIARRHLLAGHVDDAILVLESMNDEGD